MKCFTIAVAAFLATTTVHAAEIYQWKDENGKTVMSDKPPTGGTRATRTIAADAPAAKTTPQQTAADRELDFRKRQQESQEKDDKAQKELAAAADKKDNCGKARRYLETLESGERIGLRDDKGERYFMEDAQRQQEITKARQSVQATCN